MLESAVIAGIAGAVAAGLASLLVRDKARNRVAYVGVMILLFAVLNGLGRAYVLPEIRERRAHQHAEETIQKNPLLSALARKHPEFRERFHQMLVDVLREGMSEVEAARRGEELGQSEIAAYVQRSLPATSSEALVGFYLMVTEVVDRLAQGRDPRCFKLLAGTQSGTEVWETLTADEQGRMQQGLALVIEAAPAKLGPTPPTERLEADLAALMESFAAKQGEQSLAALATLASASEPDDPVYVCQTAAAFFRELLSLPEPRRSDLLRHTISSG